MSNMYVDFVFIPDFSWNFLGIHLVGCFFIIILYVVNVSGDSFYSFALRA